MKILYKILLVACVSVIYFGCDDTVTVKDVDNRVIPDSNVSYINDIRPVLEVKCVGCHGRDRTEGGVNLSEWTYFVDYTIVVPNFPENSELVWVIEDNGIYSHRGKQKYVPFTDNQIRGTKTWIAEGALNN